MKKESSFQASNSMGCWFVYQSFHHFPSKDMHPLIHQHEYIPFIKVVACSLFPPAVVTLERRQSLLVHPISAGLVRFRGLAYTFQRLLHSQYQCPQYPCSQSSVLIRRKESQPASHEELYPDLPVDSSYVVFYTTYRAKTTLPTPKNHLGIKERKPSIDRISGIAGWEGCHTGLSPKILWARW